MKRIILLCGLASALFASCASMTELDALDMKYNQLNRRYELVQSELLELREENASLTRMNQSLSSDMSETALRAEIAEHDADSLQRRLEQVLHHYDTTIENYVQEVAGKSRDLTRAQNLLTARNKELAERARDLQAKELQLQEQQDQLRIQRSEHQAKEAELLAKQRKLEAEESATRKRLERTEKELESVRESVAKALTGFTGKGLQVDTKDGRVYVSLDNKLLFPSASWEVSKDGVNAIKNLAAVLEADSTLKIIVEGHTDNDAYRGISPVKDNWDLSVMRATTIVKLLLKYGPSINPSRIEACGHGEFAPKVPNDSPEHKAMNRRTEIILTPNLDKLLQEVGT